MLTKKHINEFQEIYKKQFGKDISYIDASTQAIRLFELTKIAVDITRSSVNNDVVIDRENIKDLR